MVYCVLSCCNVDVGGWWVASGWMGGGAMRGLPRQSDKDSEAFSLFFELSKLTLSFL